MTGSRLTVVLRLRELVERQRLAERATAQRAAAAAEAGRTSAIVARADAVMVPGTALVPCELTAHRVGVVALGDAVERADEVRLAAGRAVVTAEQRSVTAAIERRSAERLRDRRVEAAARAADKLEARRLDDVALQIWRRTSTANRRTSTAGAR